MTTLRRAAYVREATRFKSTRASVNVPSRNEEVVRQAEQQAVHVGMPVTVARATFETILNSSVPFEQCIVSF
jgi:chorismate mutase